jgi:hypothetical protein
MLLSIPRTIPPRVSIGTRARMWARVSLMASTYCEPSSKGFSVARQGGSGGMEGDQAGEASAPMNVFSTRAQVMLPIGRIGNGRIVF